MNLDKLRERLRRQPFKPFRVHLSDGKSYDVLHPEMLLITKTWLVIAVFDEGVKSDDYPDREVHVSPMHVTATEDLPHSQNAA